MNLFYAAMSRFNKAVSFIILATAIPAVTYRFVEAGSWMGSIDLLGYFTVQSNIMVIVVVALQWAGVNVKVQWKLALAAAIGVTAIIFQLFLRQAWNPGGISALVSNINHGSTAVLYFLWLSGEKDRGKISMRDLWIVIPYPALYCLFGIFEAFYRSRPIRYFFLDIRTIGWGTFLIWFAVLAALFLVIGFIVILFYGKRSVKFNVSVPNS